MNNDLIKQRNAIIKKLNKEIEKAKNNILPIAYIENRTQEQKETLLGITLTLAVQIELTKFQLTQLYEKNNVEKDEAYYKYLEGMEKIKDQALPRKKEQ